MAEKKTKAEMEMEERKIAAPVEEAPAEIEEIELEEESAEAKARKKDEKIGIAYITSSPNNTIVHITDLAGNTISRISGGMVTKHSRLKANPTIAMFVAKRASERAKDLGFTRLYVRMKGVTGNNHGPGANSAVKSLGKVFDLISILDTTKMPRGGPKAKGGRRGRRV
jgi:small subunit ribosomal protein S11